MYSLKTYIFRLHIHTSSSPIHLLLFSFFGQGRNPNIISDFSVNGALAFVGSDKPTSFPATTFHTSCLGCDESISTTFCSLRNISTIGMVSFLYVAKRNRKLSTLSSLRPLYLNASMKHQRGDRETTETQNASVISIGRVYWSKHTQHRALAVIAGVHQPTHQNQHTTQNTTYLARPRILSSNTDKGHSKNKVQCTVAKSPITRFHPS